MAAVRTKVALSRNVVIRAGALHSSPAWQSSLALLVRQSWQGIILQVATPPGTGSANTTMVLVGCVCRPRILLGMPRAVSGHAQVCTFSPPVIACAVRASKTLLCCVMRLRDIPHQQLNSTCIQPEADSTRSGRIDVTLKVAIPALAHELDRTHVTYACFATSCSSS